MQMQPGGAEPRAEEATTSPGANADGGGCCNDEERTRSRGPKQASPERKKRLPDEPSYDSTIAGAAEKSVAVPSSAKRRDTLEQELEAVYGGMGDVFSDSTVVASPLAKTASEMDLELEIACLWRRLQSGGSALFFLFLACSCTTILPLLLC